MDLKNKSMASSSTILKEKDKLSKSALSNLDPERYYVEFAHACARAMPNKDCSKYFKRYDTRELPRVTKILGALKSIQPATVADIGSGRGRLLWPMVYNLPNTMFSSYELNQWRYEVINAVSIGGVSRLSAYNEDISKYNGTLLTYDAVVASEVLEHIPDVQKALTTIVRISKKWIIITVPNKPDNNPDHIHFLKPENFEKMFDCAEKDSKKEIKKITFDYTPKELVVYARVK